MINKYDPIRTPFNLNGDWLLREDKAENAMFFQNTGNDDDWRKIHVPSDIATCFPERPYNTGVFWYRKAFTLDESFSSRRIILHFDAVNYLSHIYMNGKYLGLNRQGYLPFDVDITDSVKTGEKNELLVRVDTRRKQGQLPTSFLWKNYSGILRDVCIYSTAQSYIDTAHVEAHADGKAIFTTKIVSAEALTEKIAVKDAEGNTIFEAETRAQAELSLEAKCENINIWSVDSPTLYTAEISLINDGKIIDRKSFSFGFRDIEARDSKILLNGEEIFLKGFNRHEDHPISGGASCEEAVKSDFKMIKESGANFIRMCHYPHDERELDEADRLGLLLLVEIPLCGYLYNSCEVDGEDEKAPNEITYMNAYECLTRMIERDRNHPSVIIWSVSNENNEPAETDVIDNHKALLQLAKKLDPTRLASHVSMYGSDPKRDSFYHYDDIICINTYRTLLGRLKRRDENYDCNKSKHMIKDILEGIKISYPGKPVVLTEFGYRTKVAFDSVDDEKIQAEVISHEFMAARESVCGASVWLFADHLWADCPSASDTSNVSRYGLLNRDRTKKEAYDVYCDLLKKA